MQHPYHILCCHVARRSCSIGTASQSAHTGIAHPKDLLDRQPQIGESVRVNYSDSKGAVREFRERSKAQDRSR